MSNNATFRFYEELNDFLPKSKRKTNFTVNFKGNPAVKDVIESVGVPHTEVDLVLDRAEVRLAPLLEEVTHQSPDLPEVRIKAADLEELYREITH